MGKKMRKKARSGQKDKRAATSSPKTVAQDPKPSTAPAAAAAEVDSVPTAAKERKECAHFADGVKLADVTSKLGSVESFPCEDCREGAFDRKARKGKAGGKTGKKKGGVGSADSKADSRATWVCLECGHFACGGVGLPTTSNSHAIRHFRQTKHPLVIQAERPHVRWCFPCSALVPVERLRESGDQQQDPLADIVKLMKKQPSKSASIDVEDVFFGSGSVLSETKLQKSVLLNNVNVRGSYEVRGLLNLGNTCFFNSVMQNILAMERLRESLLKLEDSTGPLTSSLKKLYAEMSPDNGVRGAVNPRSLFGSVCAQAPQFRGYQQQDSHELLRCMLDGLSSEDLKSRRSNDKSSGNKSSSHNTHSFIDAIFAGELSSTVCCKTCGHTSVVYEPFLDLSLPIPTKKPPAKNAQSLSRTRKTKPPPRRAGKTRPKVNSKDVILLPAQRDSNSTTSFESSSHSLQPNVVSTVDNDAFRSESCSGSTSQDPGGDKSFFHDAPSVEKAVDSDDTTLMNSDKPILLPEKPAEQAVGNDNSTWLDVLETVSSSNEQVLATQCNGFSESQDFEVTDQGHSDAPKQDMATPSDENGLPNHNNDEAIVKSDTAANSWEDEAPLQAGYSELEAAEDSTWMDFVEPVSHNNDEAIVKSDTSANSWEDEAPLQGGYSELEAADDSTWMDFVEPVSHTDEQLLSAQYNKLSISQDFGMTDQGLNNASQQDTATHSDGWHNYWEEEAIVKSDTGVNSWDDEVPAQVGASEVLLLPYTEETSANVGDMGEGDVGPSSPAVSGFGDGGAPDFDGFGAMFDEPEDSGGPSVVESSVISNGALVNGPLPKNSSESDPDEVDNSNSPVSIESCLSLFTKPEDLTKEHAWHCENCSKLLREKKRKSRKRLRSASSNGKISQDEAVTANGNIGNGGSNHALKKTVDPGEEEADNSSSHHQGSGAGATSDEAGARSNNAGDDSPQPSNQLADDDQGTTTAGSSKVSGLVVDESDSGKSDKEEEEETHSKSVKVMRDATKRFMIGKLPPILTIHLKRFSQDSRFRLSKLSGHIVFKEIIDLGPFMDPRSKEKERGGGEYKYRLTGIVEHMGSMRGGHYVAYVRGGGGDRRKGGEEEGSGGQQGSSSSVWYYASDAHVSETNLEEVLRQEAYILFYEKLV